ncbi:MAG TPA: hypothetical protein VGP22_10195 [Albitalea sp.]|nr:hypothetical protein [Albitalea sp.]
MRRVFAASAVASLLCLASSAMALGFGPVHNATRLGQPLDFSIAVKLDPDESLRAQCVAAEVTAGDTRIPPPQVRTRLLRGPGPNDAVVRVGTSGRINEPVVTVLVSLGCPPRVSHKFVSLLDPPLAAKPPLARAAAASAAMAATPPAAAAPLELPAAATALDAEERMRDRELLLSMEERVQRLTDDQQALQQNVAQLQSRLRDAEQARHTDPALYGLATLVVLLLAVIALLLWRHARLRSEQNWLNDAQALTDLGPRPSEAQRVRPASPSFDEETMTSMRVVPESSYSGLPTEPAPAPSSPREPAQTTIPSAARMRRELSPEELIDLEQQADFFIALGQEEAAIDLLMGHVRSSGGTSPMPYLKLLEIYRRRGEGEAYERIRERFNRRFNAYAPEWAQNPREQRALDAHPDVVSRLQVVWAVPAHASDLLENLLFRRDTSRGSFDLPAYEELLFLYALARDLVEHERLPEGVDLLLPLSPGDESSSIVRADASRAHGPPAPRPVDVELDFGAPAPSER